MKKNSVEGQHISVEVYSYALTETWTCQKRISRFRCGDFGLEDEEPERPKKFEKKELEALLNEDFCQIKEELSESLRVTQTAISKLLKAADGIGCHMNSR